MSIFPFHIFSEKELNDVANATLKYIEEWSLKWLGKVDFDVEVDNCFSTEEELEGLNNLRLKGDNFFFNISEDNIISILSRALNENIDPEFVGHPVFQRLLREIFDDFFRLFEFPGTVSEFDLIPSEIQNYGAGWLRAKVIINSKIIFYVYASEQLIAKTFFVARECFSDASLIVPVESTILNEFVEVGVKVGRSYLEFGYLDDLQVGDVIKLDSKIENEMEVCVAAVIPFAGGFLCEKNGKYAVNVNSKVEFFDK